MRGGESSAAFLVSGAVTGLGDAGRIAFLKGNVWGLSDF